eukprot:2543244-Pleurochrysis_carterae.AAC.1
MILRQFLAHAFAHHHSSEKKALVAIHGHPCLISLSCRLNPLCAGESSLNESTRGTSRSAAAHGAEEQQKASTSAIAQAHPIQVKGIGKIHKHRHARACEPTRPTSTAVTDLDEVSRAVCGRKVRADTPEGSSQRRL